MNARIAVPTGPGGPIFDGTRDSWAVLTNQRRRYAWVHMTVDEREVFDAMIDASARAGAPGLASQVLGFSEEISDYVLRLGELFLKHKKNRVEALPFLARRRIEAETERLFGTKALDWFNVMGLR